MASIRTAGLTKNFGDLRAVNEVVVNEIPIAMVVLSRALPLPANRRANIIAAIVTIAFAVGGGLLTPHYLFFASVEVAALLFFIWTAWTWREAVHHPRAISSGYVG